MKILNRYTKEKIFEYECDTIKECVLKAKESGANLRGADLSGAKVFNEKLTKNLIYINSGFDYQIWISDKKNKNWLPNSHNN